MKRTLIITAVALLAVAVFCSGRKKQMYTNPVLSSAYADPTVFYNEPDGYYYVFATGRQVRRARSKDLVHWEELSPAFDTMPRHVDGAKGIWAPDVERIGDKYVMYYCQNKTKPGGNPKSSIGVAVSDRIDGTFHDLGIMFRAEDVGIPGGCIDEFYWEENGQKYLFFGSFKGLYGLRLSDDGLSIQGKASDKRQIAGNAYEGGMLYKRGSFYYLFASTGRCCAGKNSTYATVVGRSENIWGPYLNEDGDSMMDNADKVLLTSSERFVGPGHNSDILTLKDGSVWLLYHSYDMTENNGDPHSRMLMLDRINFDKYGWPSISDGHPSLSAVAPAL